MKYFLDTNVCIDALRSRSDPLIRRLHSIHPKDIGLSVLVVAELRYGADYSNNPIRNHHLVDAFLSPFEIQPVHENVAIHYGSLYANLRKKGQLIGIMDTLIAAHALALGVILITNNLKEFQKVPGLVCENWF